MAQAGGLGGDGGGIRRGKLRIGTAQALRSKMAAAGISTDAEIEEYVGLLSDPARIAVDPSVISVWGRRAREA